MKIAVVMPAHNEQGYLEPAVKSVVTGLRDRGYDFEVIIVENGSTDNTYSEAADLYLAYPEVELCSLALGNYGIALRKGFETTWGDVVVNFDVDFVDLDFLDQAIKSITAGADVVIGSKRNPYSDDQRDLKRQTVTAVFAWVLKQGFGLKASDTHGIKAFRWETVAPLVAQTRSDGEIFDTELIIRAERAGLVVKELPVTIIDTRPPRTSMASRIPRTLLALARLRLRL